ncbi:MULTISPECIES: hypothetical protein [unclassified Acidovorax]|uniref:hypothetical protein n=1 Tax=unclassified Acidovorax TaxID=2684926 RepID=UPI002882ECE0|nr:MULTISPECIES: hypothetical protein [unclassified Acidovorax]
MATYVSHRKPSVKRRLIAAGAICMGMAAGLLECIALLRSQRLARGGSTANLPWH